MAGVSGRACGMVGGSARSRQDEYVFVGEELVDNYSNGIFFLLFYRFLVVPEGKLVSNWSCQTLDSPCLCSLLQDFV